MEPPPVGSLVVPAPKYRESMATGEGAAILLALRRGSGHLYYPATDRGFWVPTRQLRAIPADVLPEGCLERTLSDVLLFVDADECTLETSGNGAMDLAIEIPGLSQAHLRELRWRTRDWLADFSFVPGSMRCVLLRLKLVNLPEAAAEGR